MSAQGNDLELVEAWIREACILEAWARKPGNVHPTRAFADTRYEDFVASAEAVAAPLARAQGCRLGESILSAVRATQERTGKNTNLGIVLLLAPLCSAPRSLLAGVRTSGGRAALRGWLRSFLASLTVRDAELTYEAIRIASPGGLGSAPSGDAREAPTGTLLAMMELAKDRDLIARQYSSAFEQVIDEGLPALQSHLEEGRPLELSIILTFLGILARHGDSLIARKCGEATSQDAARRSRKLLEAGWPDLPAGEQHLEDLDAWLRADGNRRNPGSTADLIAAVLFLARASGILSAASIPVEASALRMQKYTVRVTKDYLTFCSAHFISFEGTQCERLHGHNYRISAEIEAPLNDDYLVFDFIVLKSILRDIANELDHRMLVPLRSKSLDVNVADDSVKIRYGSKQWIFPIEDCALLDLENTTAELLARWVSGRLRESMIRHSKSVPSPPRMPEIIRVEVEESPGQSATYESNG